MSQTISQQPSAGDLELLAAVSQLLTDLDRDRVLERVIDLTVSTMGATRASLLLHPEHSSEWQQVFVKSQRDDIERYDEERSIHFARRVLEHGLAGWVVRERTGALVVDTHEDPRWCIFPDSDSGARSAICVPFLFGDEVLGVLTVLHTEPGYFTDQDLRLLMIVANQATVALRNSYLFNRMLQQQRQLEAILHAMPEILLVVDEGGKLLLANAAAAQFLGEAAQDLYGRPLADYAHSDSVFALIHDIIASPLQAGQSWSFDARSDQQQRDYLVNVSVWQNPSNAVAGYVIAMRDVTTLRDLNRFKDEMLQIASHDLRSPLALIVGYCSLIALDAPEGSPILEYLDVILKSTERMKDLLDDLLRVEQIRTSPLELHEEVDFAELINIVLNNLRSLADSRKQRLDAHLELDDVPGMLVNRVLIREVMENLLNNALKYTPECGRIRVLAYARAGRLNFVVEDNGIGIPREALSRLFESFYRVRRPEIEQVDGRGFGLSLVKTIIERHRGEVWVESEENVGSRFGFWLPLPSVST